MQTLRLRTLHTMLLPNVTIDSSGIKKDAWIAKSFGSFVKKKKSRGHRSRVEAFNGLMDALGVSQLKTRKC